MMYTQKLMSNIDKPKPYSDHKFPEKKPTKFHCRNTPF